MIGRAPVSRRPKGCAFTVRRVRPDGARGPCFRGTPLAADPSPPPPSLSFGPSSRLGSLFILSSVRPAFIREGPRDDVNIKILLLNIDFSWSSLCTIILYIRRLHRWAHYSAATVNFWGWKVTPIWFLNQPDQEFSFNNFCLWTKKHTIIGILRQHCVLEKLLSQRKKLIIYIH